MLLGLASRKGPLQDGVCFFHLPEGEKKTKKRRVIATFYNLAVCGRLEDISEASRNRPLKEPVKGLAVRKKTNVPQVFPSLSKRTSDFLSRLAIVCSEGGFAASKLNLAFLFTGGLCGRRSRQPTLFDSSPHLILV